MKTLKTALLASVLSILLWGPPARACEDGHRIEDVVSDGAVIVLEDGSSNADQHGLRGESRRTENQVMDLWDDRKAG